MVFTFLKSCFLKMTETICDSENLKYVLSGYLEKKVAEPSLGYQMALPTWLTH